MKILHIGWGFRPWRGGGLIEYAEDLMGVQARHGYKVFYFFSGRHYPFLKTPRLIRWKRKSIAMYEVISSPIIHSGDKGSFNPDLDIAEPFTENFFKKVLNEIKPDIIHIQELAGLPSSLIEIIKENNLPVVMTLQDYFLLCPTLKLFDTEGNICLDKNIGNKYVICCKNASKNNLSLIKNTFIYEVKKRKWCYFPLKFLYSVFFKSFLRKIRKYSFSKIENFNRNQGNLFQKRRDININRLNKIDLLIAQSYKVEKIYRKFLQRTNGIITLHFTVKHIEYIKERKMKDVEFPINFVILNGCVSIAKGAKLILETLKKLNKKPIKKYFKLHILGGLAEEIEEEILSFNNVIYHGPYRVDQLNELLEEMDVGIVPSLWEEAYGYVGIELLAKGIPVIGNKRGGITDYVIENVTGWVNKSCSSSELADIIQRIIENPEKILVLNKKIIQNKNKIIKNMEQHFLEIDKIYKELLQKI